MQDRRKDIIEAGLATLQEHGYVGFTQPRVASRAGLRQSHLTYYYPTRTDLLAAVGKAAIERQLAAVDMALAAPTPQAVAGAIAAVAARREATRVMLALAQASDQDPQLHDLFRTLADGLIARCHRFLKAIDPAASELDARLLHAMGAGLSLINLATDRENAMERGVVLIERTLALLLARPVPPSLPL